MQGGIHDLVFIVYEQVLLVRLQGVGRAGLDSLDDQGAGQFTGYADLADVGQLLEDPADGGVGIGQQEIVPCFKSRDLLDLLGRVAGFAHDLDAPNREKHGQGKYHQDEHHDQSQADKKAGA